MKDQYYSTDPDTRKGLLYANWVQYTQVKRLYFAPISKSGRRAEDTVRVVTLKALTAPMDPEFEHNRQGLNLRQTAIAWTAWAKSQGFEIVDLDPNGEVCHG